MKRTLDKPLSDDEIDRLDGLLLDLETETMDVSMLDGFLTAIVVGPKTIMPSEWMRWVWDSENGTEAPEFESEAQAHEIIGLMMRHMNDIAATLMHSPDIYEPLIMERQQESGVVPVIDEWCTGFMAGVQLDAAGWLPVTTGHADWIETIRLYGTEGGWAELKEKRLPLDEHKALAAGIGDTVRKLHAFWLEQRKAQHAAGREPPVIRGQPLRNPDKIGRNAPCPCGSGRKYKRCHGAPGALH